MNIELTIKAEKTLDQNIDFLVEHWGKKVATDYKARVDKCMSLVAQNYQIGSIFFVKGKAYRKFLIVKQIYMVYKVMGKRIVVVAFWNNYQDPKKLKKFLS